MEETANHTNADSGLICSLMVEDVKIFALAVLP
jgi:hypothetical protein